MQTSWPSPPSSTRYGSRPSSPASSCSSPSRPCSACSSGLVKIIDRRVVKGQRDTLKAAAANTADAALIPQVANGVEAVLAEGLQHHLFLGRVLGKVRS